MRTKIIATVGPACANVIILRKMIKEGVNVFRMNFSHGTRDSHELMLKKIKKAQTGSGRSVLIMQDLAGHRIRTGHLRGGRAIVLKPNQRFRLYRGSKVGSKQGVSMDYAGDFSRIGRDRMVYVADGKIHLKVLKSSKDHIDTVVIQEGRLGERKGINIPGVSLDFPPIGEKDLEDIKFAIDHNIHFVAQSFVRSTTDIQVVKHRLALQLPSAKIIAKIEDREGLNNFASILRVADGIMVARGDLGISVPIYEIPILQKWMVAACNHVDKPVITATQMLENMVDHRQPTRAEVGDVANAVIDGSDYVMLSGETAIGRFPVESVKMMRRIIEHTTHHAPYRGVRRNR